MLLDGIKGIVGWAYNMSIMYLPETINATTKLATDILNQTTDIPSKNNRDYTFALGISTMVFMGCLYKFLFRKNKS